MNLILGGTPMRNLDDDNYENEDDDELEEEDETSQ